jgi:hypothetical protein
VILKKMTFPSCVCCAAATATAAAAAAAAYFPPSHVRMDAMIYEFKK